jgi:hypothetical protein
VTRRSWHEPQTVGVEGLPMFAPDVAAAPPRHEGTRTVKLEMPALRPLLCPLHPQSAGFLALVAGSLYR